MKKNSQAVVNHNTKGHTYGFGNSGGEQQNTPFKTNDFQYNPGNFCYEIVENSSFDPDEGKSFRQLNKNRFKPLGITGKTNYRRSPVPQATVPDFGELRQTTQSQLTNEERFKLSGFKHRATFSVEPAMTGKPTKTYAGEQVLHRRYNEFTHHQGKWTYQLPNMLKQNNQLELRTFNNGSPYVQKPTKM